MKAIFGILGLLVGLNAGAQPFSNIVLASSCPLVAVVSNGTLYITSAVQRINDTNGFTVAFVVYSPAIPDAGPLSVTIDSSAGTYSAHHAPIHQWSYFWGDGSAVENRTDYPDANFVSHTFPTAGTYNFTLVATDSAGNTNSLSRQLTVPVPALTITAAAQPGSVTLDSLNRSLPLLQSTNLQDWVPAGRSLPALIPASQRALFYRFRIP